MARSRMWSRSGMIAQTDGELMNIMRARKTALSAGIGTATAFLLLASATTLFAQHDKDKPSRPAPSHQSAPARSSAPAQTHHSESAPPSHSSGNSTPHSNPSTPSTPSPRTGSSTYGGGNRGTGGSQTVAPSGSSNGNNRPGSGTVYNGAS